MPQTLSFTKPIVINITAGGPGHYYGVPMYETAERIEVRARKHPVLGNEDILVGFGPTQPSTWWTVPACSEYYETFNNLFSGKNLWVTCNVAGIIIEIVLWLRHSTGRV